MKTVLIVALTLMACACLAEPAATNAADAAKASTDAAVIAAAVPGVKRIDTTSSGFTLQTVSGTRTAYRTLTGYYVPGSSTTPALDIRQTTTGYTVQNAAVRADAMRAAQTKR